MRTKKSSKQAITAILLVLIINACRHELPDPNGTGGTGGGNPPPVTTCSPDTAYFVRDILPIISSNCTMSGCHDNVTHADGVNLTTYDKILRYVVPRSASSSKLYKMIMRTDDERMPPAPMSPLSATQKALIEKWINQGALNNNCIGTCDSSVFTYSGAVKPIIDTKCRGCHNPASLGGNIDLSTYTSVKAAALNGKLYGSVAQLPGYSPMPKNALKLLDCEIQQIQKWIQSGSPNN